MYFLFLQLLLRMFCNMYCSYMMHMHLDKLHIDHFDLHKIHLDKHTCSYLCLKFCLMMVYKPDKFSMNQLSILDNVGQWYNQFANNFHQHLRNNLLHKHKLIFLYCHILLLYSLQSHKKCMCMHCIDSYHIEGHICYKLCFPVYLKMGNIQNYIRKFLLKASYFDQNHKKYIYFKMSKFCNLNYKLSKMIEGCHKIHLDSYSCC